MRVMRPSKNGGISPCSSPEDKVGKGRCHHILEEGDNIVLEYDNKERSYFLNVKNNLNENMSVEVDKKLALNFIENISSSLSDEQKEKIFKFLSQED